MESDQLQRYLPIAFLATFFLWRRLRYRRVKARITSLLAEGATVVDVRSPSEFASGAREGSLNIPLAQLDVGAARLDPEKPVILCCASGMRSSSATALLKKKGFRNVVDAGPWRNTL